jgi:acetyl esterase/lipase
MASGPGSGAARLTLVAVLLAGCNAATVTTTAETTTTSSSPTFTTVVTTTTTTVSTTTTTTGPEIAGEVMVPDGDGPFPAVVVVHGGGWMLGSPIEIRPLARFLTDAGFLTVNAAYKLSNQSPGFPEAVEDIACAVRYAASHPDSDGTVAVVGFSAGAHIAALVALTGYDYPGSCPFQGSGTPDRLVGLAGIYDVRPMGILMVPFFGSRIDLHPEPWSRGNPQEHVGANPALVAYILHGELDSLVDRRFADSFHQGLSDAGAVATLDIVAGARHTDMSRPEVIGELVVSWLRSAEE